jgi:3-dehydroquinate dehydratase-2
MEIWVINGPNLNFLGKREVEIYGNASYQELKEILENEAQKLNVKLKVLQSNSEGQIIDWIQKAEEEKIDGILLNPAAYTHYSLAIADSLRIFSGKKLEIHLTNWYGRVDRSGEKSVISPYVDGVISGLGIDSYIIGLRWMSDGS